MIHSIYNEDFSVFLWGQVNIIIFALFNKYKYI